MHAAHARPSVRLAQATALAVALVFSVLAQVTPAEATRIGPNFFGMHDSRISSGVLTRASIGSVRIWDTGTSWRDIEKRKGRFDFQGLDTAVTTAVHNRVRPLIVLGQTPRFHATRPHAPGAYGRGATSMPRLNAWKRYVAKVASRYGTSADYQVWNEPNVVNYWTGSVGQMALLTATASNTIKRVAGRAATVVAPSFPLRLPEQQRWFRAYWQAKVGGRSVARYVNVVSANLYPLADQAPEASMKLVATARAALPQSARRLPFWDTEINYGLLGGDSAKRIPAWRQAAFVARTLALNAGDSIGRVYWYSWGIGTIANTHLSKRDGARLTQAGRAWNVVERWLVGTDAEGCHQGSSGNAGGIYTCVFRAARGDVRRIYWKPSGPDASVETNRSTRSWSSLTGNTTKRSGRFRLQVGQTPVLVISRH